MAEQNGSIYTHHSRKKDIKYQSVIPQYWLGIEETAGNSLISLDLTFEPEHPSSISNLHFLPIKTPLSSSNLSLIPNKFRWGPKEAIGKARSFDNSAKIAFVDLDNFPNELIEKEFQDLGIEYIPCQIAEDDQYYIQDILNFYKKIKECFYKYEETNTIFLISSYNPFDKSGFIIAGYLIKEYANQIQGNSYCTTSTDEKNLQSILKQISKCLKPGITWRDAVKVLKQFEKNNASITKATKYQEIELPPRPRFLFPFTNFRRTTLISTKLILPYPIEKKEIYDSIYKFLCYSFQRNESDYCPGFFYHGNYSFPDPRRSVWNDATDISQLIMKESLSQKKLTNHDYVLSRGCRISFVPDGLEVFIICNKDDSIYLAYYNQFYKIKAKINDPNVIPFVFTGIISRNLFRSDSLVNIYATDALFVSKNHVWTKPLDQRLQYVWDVLKKITILDHDYSLLFRAVARMNTGNELVHAVQHEKDFGCPIAGFEIIPQEKPPGISFYLPGKDSKVPNLYRDDAISVSHLPIINLYVLTNSKFYAILYGRRDVDNKLEPVFCYPFRQISELDLDERVVSFQVYYCSSKKEIELMPLNIIPHAYPDRIEKFKDICKFTMENTASSLLLEFLSRENIINYTPSMKIPLELIKEDYEGAGESSYPERSSV